MWYMWYCVVDVVAVMAASMVDMAVTTGVTESQSSSAAGRVDDTMRSHSHPSSVCSPRNNNNNNQHRFKEYVMELRSCQKSIRHVSP